MIFNMLYYFLFQNQTNKKADLNYPPSRSTTTYALYKKARTSASVEYFSASYVVV